MLAWDEQSLERRSQADANRERIESQTVEQPLRAFQLQEIAHVLRRENGLKVQEQTIPPRTQLAAVGGIECLGATGANQVEAKVTLAIGPPLGVVRR